MATWYSLRRLALFVIRFCVQKMVSTTIRPTKLCYPEMHTWQGCARFVSDHVVYQPLECPHLMVSTRLHFLTWYPKWCCIYLDWFPLKYYFVQKYKTTMTKQNVAHCSITKKLLRKCPLLYTKLNTNISHFFCKWKM